MNTTRLAIAAVSVLSSLSTAFDIESGALYRDLNHFDVLQKIQLPDCFPVGDVSRVFSYSCSADGTELVLAQPDSTPVLEVITKNDALLLLYDDQEDAPFRWVNADAIDSPYLTSADRRFFLERGESLQLTPCGNDFVVQKGVDLTPEEHSIATIWEKSGQLLIHEWEQEPQDMDGGGKSSGATGGQGEDKDKGYYGEYGWVKAGHRYHGTGARGGDDRGDDDPERRRVQPRVLAQCEASAVPDYASMTTKQLLKALKRAKGGDQTKAIIKTVIEKYNKCAKTASSISPKTMSEFYRIAKDYKLPIGNELIEKLKRCMD